jgi:hypothetical protein
MLAYVAPLEEAAVLQQLRASMEALPQCGPPPHTAGIPEHGPDMPLDHNQLEGDGQDRDPEMEKPISMGPNSSPQLNTGRGEACAVSQI